LITKRANTNKTNNNKKNPQNKKPANVQKQIKLLLQLQWCRSRPYTLTLIINGNLSSFWTHTHFGQGI
jgi:hypothetical protein